MSVSVKLEVAEKPMPTFDVFTEELSLALHRLGFQFEAKAGGVVRERGKDVGHVISWKRGKRVQILWHPAEWEPNLKTRIVFRFLATKRGTRVIVAHNGFGRIVGEEKDELLGWFSDQVAAPLLSSLAPSRFGDWLTDRRARRPVGAMARKTYRNPTHHRPNFNAILKELALSKHDHLVEIGCGGGAFLEDALKSDCKAAAVDHSPEMVRLARRVNARAIKAGRLDIRETEADSLPFKDSTFTCAVMTSVLGFLPDPVRVFDEIRRVLVTAGRLVVFTTSKETKGTPATPEPIASRVHFYEDSDLIQMALEAGFKEPRVEHPDLSKFARGSGIPKRNFAHFSSSTGQLLLAKK